MNGKLIMLGLVLSAEFTGSAWAAISPGDGAAGNPPGEIFVTVWDAAHQVSYTRDLGIAITDFVANPNQTLTLAPDGLYTSTFSGVDPATLVYSVGGFNARFDDFPCCYGMAISSNSTPAQIFLPDVTALVTTLSVGGFYAIGVNGDAGDPTNFGADVSALSHPGSGGYYDGENWGGDIGFTVPFQTGATVGTDLAFHTLILDEDGTTVNRTTLTNKWNIAADGTITYFGGVDSDGDGVADNADNCTIDANADQRDTDADGIGNICDADFDNNCAVNFTDLGSMKAVFFQPGTVDTDMNGDGQTNFTDLGLLKGDFFQPPGPSGIPNICSP
jgi:hypothetical protein